MKNVNRKHSGNRSLPPYGQKSCLFISKLNTHTYVRVFILQIQFIILKSKTEINRNDNAIDERTDGVIIIYIYISGQKWNSEFRNERSCINIKTRFTRAQIFMVGKMKENVLVAKGSLGQRGKKKKSKWLETVADEER